MRALNDKIEKQVRVFLENPEVGICFTDYSYFIGDKHETQFKSTKSSFTNPIVSQVEFMRTFLLDNICND